MAGKQLLLYAESNFPDIILDMSHPLTEIR